MDNRALFNIGYGLYVLTAKDGNKHNGCIVNTVMQVTSNPVTVAVGVSKENLTHDMILKTKEFNICILTQSTPFEVFKHFGFQSGKVVDKFENYKHKLINEKGLMNLSTYINSYIYCKVSEVIDFGTHSLFKADVIDAKIENLEETVTYTYYQNHIKPKVVQQIEKGWRCNICGYIHKDEFLPEDFICPICKHGVVDFIKI